MFGAKTVSQNTLTLLFVFFPFEMALPDRILTLLRVVNTGGIKNLQVCLLDNQDIAGIESGNRTRFHQFIEDF